MLFNGKRLGAGHSSLNPTGGYLRLIHQASFVYFSCVQNSTLKFNNNISHNNSHCKLWREPHIITSNAITITTHIVHIIANQCSRQADNKVSNDCRMRANYCSVIWCNGQQHWVKWSLLICVCIFFCLCTWNVVLVLRTVKSCCSIISGSLFPENIAF